MPKRKPTHTFPVYIDRTEVSRVLIEVQAANAIEAKRLALREVEAQKIAEKPEQWRSQSVIYTCPFVIDQRVPLLVLPSWREVKSS
jgi:hypothetical protein